MKKIAVFHPSSELYGADRIMVIATKALSNFHPVIYLPSYGPLVSLIYKELPSATVKIVEDMPIISRALFNPIGALAVMRKFVKFSLFVRRENKRYKFQKVYVNTLACSPLLPIVKRLKVPVITHVHEILEKPKVAAQLTAWLAFRYSDAVISVSKAVEQNLHRLCKRRKALSVVVHNGILPIRPVRAANSEKLTFYLFGRIKPEKGQWYLLEALKLIPKEELSKAHFCLVGGTLAGKEDLKLDLELKIKQYGLTDNVEMKPFVENIAKEMACADVCLIPSLMKDPFPTTVLEAMSAGKAVIASDTGGAKEAIVDKETGFIITADNPKEFSQTIRALINKPELAKKTGMNAQTAFQQKFTLTHFNERWLKAVKAG